MATALKETKALNELKHKPVMKILKESLCLLWICCAIILTI